MTATATAVHECSGLWCACLSICAGCGSSLCGATTCATHTRKVTAHLCTNERGDFRPEDKAIPVEWIARLAEEAKKEERARKVWGKLSTPAELGALAMQYDDDHGTVRFSTIGRPVLASMHGNGQRIAWQYGRLLASAGKMFDRLQKEAKACAICKDFDPRDPDYKFRPGYLETACPDHELYRSIILDVTWGTLTNDIPVHADYWDSHPEVNVRDND